MQHQTVRDGRFQITACRPSGFSLQTPPTLSRPTPSAIACPVQVLMLPFVPGASRKEQEEVTRVLVIVKLRIKAKILPSCVSRMSLMSGVSTDVGFWGSGAGPWQRGCGHLAVRPGQWAARKY